MLQLQEGTAAWLPAPWDLLLPGMSSANSTPRLGRDRDAHLSPAPRCCILSLGTISNSGGRGVRWQRGRQLSAWQLCAGRSELLLGRHQTGGGGSGHEGHDGAMRCIPAQQQWAEGAAPGRQGWAGWALSCGSACFVWVRSGRVNAPPRPTAGSGQSLIRSSVLLVLLLTHIPGDRAVPAAAPANTALCRALSAAAFSAEAGE